MENAERKALMANFLAHEGVELSEGAPAEASVKGDTTNLPNSDETPVKAPAVEVVKNPGVKSETVENKGDNKVVPLEALHEAREKIKAKTLEARKLSEELAARDLLLKEANERAERIEQEYKRKISESSEEAPAESEATRQLAEENKKLKEYQAKAAAKEQADQKAKANADMAKLVADADASLVAEGFPGFSRFTVDVGNAIVAKITAGELDEKDVVPSLWIKVYKEEVYPAIKSLFAAQVKQEKLVEKQELKKSITLVSTPGAAPSPADEVDLDAPQTAESYMKFRKSIS
jgi:hypothetical protein